MNEPQILELKEKFKSKFLHLYEIIYKNKLGDEKIWFSASRRNKKDLEEFLAHDKKFHGDAVVIIPYHREKKKLVMIDEYRIPVGGWVKAFPAGLLENGEHPLEAAKRELEEETGLKITKAFDDNTFFPSFMTPGMTEECACIVFCSCEGEFSSKGQEDDEAIKPFFIDKREAEKLLESAHLMDTKVELVLKLFIHSNYFENMSK